MPSRNRELLTVPYADRRDWVTVKMAAHLVSRRIKQVEGWINVGYVETCLHNGRRLVSLSSCRYHISRPGTFTRKYHTKKRTPAPQPPEASQAPPEAPQPAQTIAEAPQPSEASQAPPEAPQTPPEAPQTPPAPTSETTDDLRAEVSRLRSTLEQLAPLLASRGPSSICTLSAADVLHQLSHQLPSRREPLTERDVHRLASELETSKGASRQGLDGYSHRLQIRPGWYLWRYSPALVSAIADRLRGGQTVLRLQR